MKTKNASEACLLNKMARKSILSVLALGLSACAPALQKGHASLGSITEESGIVNGTTVSGSDPIAQSTVALLLETPQGTALCTGTLVSPTVVMTAAHCVEGVNRAIVIFTLNVDTATKDDARGVTRVIVNPKADLNADKDTNDVALVKFDGAAPNGYSPATLLSSATGVKSGMDVVLAGFGVTGMNMTSGKIGALMRRKPKPAAPAPSSPTPSTPRSNSGDPTLLRKVDVVLSDAAYSSSELLFKQSANGGGACHGDSGGPALATVGGKLTVIGITSRSATHAGGGTCLEGSIYTNVGAHISFIQSAIKKLEAPKP